MADPIAIKRLTASDCTLFEGVFRKIGAGNQKSINLNADVLIDKLYPGLAAVAAATDNEIALIISIFGPGAKGAHKLSRKIIKNSSYKNWRLDGEFIPGPPDDPSRYDEVQPGDLAIMAFKGELTPSGMNLIIVSQTNPADSALHATLLRLFGNRSMIAVTPAQVGAAASVASVPQSHPVNVAAIDPEIDTALEDAAQGGIEGTGKLLKNKGGRKVSAIDLARAKAKAEKVGQNGEGLIKGYLAAKVAAGQIANFAWVSAENAVAPFDYEITTVIGQHALIDVKATEGPFQNVIHLSLAEIIEASVSESYYIYRVFELTDDGGKLRISDNIRPLAVNLKTLHETHMPASIRIDSFSIATTALSWGPEEYVELPDDEESA